LTDHEIVYLKWNPSLHQALQSFFGHRQPPPQGLDYHLIGSGWAGLTLIASCFKRLELVDDDREGSELLRWMTAIKLAAVRVRCVFPNPHVALSAVFILSRIARY
jgi:hypothetical protein